MAPASIAEDQSSVVLDFVSASVAPASVVEDSPSIVLDFVSASVALASVAEDQSSVVLDFVSASVALAPIAEDSPSIVLCFTSASVALAPIAEDQSSVVLDFVSASVAQASVAEDQSSIVLDFVSASMAPTSVVEDSPSVVPGSTSGSTMLHAIAAHSTAAMRAAGPRPGPVRVPLPYSMRSRTLRFTTTLAVAVCSSTRSSAACVRLVARTPPRCSRTAPLAPRLRSCALHSWAHNLLGRQDGTDAVTDRMEPLGRARAGASPPRPLSVLLTRTGWI
jgi:hypothetical protein